MHELNHGAAGKGDKERSPGWRNNYNEIQNFQKDGIPGLVKLAPGRYRKSYGNPMHTRGGVSFENFDTGKVIEWRGSLLGSVAHYEATVNRCMPTVPQDQNGDACGCHPRRARTD
jgi:hypothetical protein